MADDGEKNSTEKQSSNGPLERKNNSFKVLGNEWRIIIILFLRPLVIIPILLSVIAIYYANCSSADKSYSLILNIIATVLTAVAGAFLYESINKIMGNTIIIKKGASAVRNLTLARHKIKNIVERIKADAKIEEIRNLLIILEKDVANATQEWNDIIPGVDKIEEAYTLLNEKEVELELANKENEKLKQDITKIGGNDKEQQSLRQELNENQKRISELIRQINILQSSTSMVASTVGSAGTSGSSGMSGYSGYSMGRCEKCGTMYRVSGLMDMGLCDDCKAKQLKSGVIGGR